MKLKTGDIIRVHGFVMLAKLEDGQNYRVQSTPTFYGEPTYQFTKARGKKFIARHLASSVDMCISDKDLNRIEVIS